MESCEGLVEFLKTMQSGSFTRAARDLGVSVAHISRQISALEARLGTKLIVRTTRRVSPTLAGEHLALQCQPLMEKLFHVQEGLCLASEAIKGVIRISGGHFVEQQVVPLLADFCARYPEVRIELDLSNRTADLLEGNLDFIVHPGPWEDSTVLVARPLREVSMVTLASPAIVKQLEDECGVPLSPQTLPVGRCLKLLQRSWHFRRGEQAHVIDPDGPLASNSAQVLINAAAAGMGVIHVPEYYLAAATGVYHLVPLFRDWLSDRTVTLNIIYVRNRLMPSRVRLLIDYLLSAGGDGAASG